MSFTKNLQKNINKVTDGYFANWTPDMPVSVGDFGLISGYRFTKEGSIKKYIDNNSIDIESIRSETAKLEKKVGLKISKGTSASGSVSSGKIGFSLKFDDDGSFLYSLKDITNNQLKQRREAFEAIGRGILAGRIKWKDEYVFVTEVKQAAKALIIVADSANADMEIECEVDDIIDLNLAEAVGKISYIKNSERVMQYEIEQNTAIFFRAVAFSSNAPDGKPTSLSIVMKKLQEWFPDGLPKPEAIYLREYTEEGITSFSTTFSLPNEKEITLCQKLVDIVSFFDKNEDENLNDQEIIVEQIQIGQKQMYG